MPGMIPLGPLELIEPIARGGMAEVWRAVHPGQGLEVAVKVIGGEGRRHRDEKKVFRNEARAVAGLDHPNIVMIFDYGEVDARVERATKGRLKAGNPYLAMEFASAGSLSQIREPLPWPFLYALLLAILDALAHAHARGVVHRDIKPANILLCDDNDPRPGLKLTDFGIARAMDRFSVSASAEVIIGTAHYMAPEQVEGQWRDQGPGTDLYALGVLAYKLSSGKRPFEGKRRFDLLRAQLYDTPPPLEPLRDVPRDFSRWVARLMEKDPRRRFGRAADAAAALVDLSRDYGEPVRADRVPTALRAALSSVMASPVTGSSTLIVHGDFTAVEPTSLPGLGELATHIHERRHLSVLTASHPGAAAVPFLAPAAEDLPDSWRQPVATPPPIQLRGAGLGLLGLRSGRLVGREPERDHLWRTLREVHRQREPRLVLLRGPRGLGGSRLAEWLAQRAHEVGAASVLKTTCQPGDPMGAPIGRMVSRHLRVARLERADALKRIRRFLEPFPNLDTTEILALAELVAPATEAEHRSRSVPTVRLESSVERYEAVRRFTLRLGIRRSVVILLDDVHFSEDAIGLAEHLLHAGGVPALLLLTTDDVELAEHPAVAERLLSLLSHPAAHTLTLEPLASSELQELVRDLLGLEETLAARVEERSAGSPLFATQIVSEWAHRGRLRPSPSGFVLRTAGADTLPDDLRTLWQGRLAHIVQGLPERALVDLERAAALGAEVYDGDWAEVCDGPAGRATVDPEATVVGPRVRARLMERLLSRRLVVPMEGGWAFRHHLLREILEQSARANHRWEQHHRACTEMLLRHGERPGFKERLGRHLVQAGEHDAAIDVLLDGVVETGRYGGNRASLSLLGTCEDAMRRLRLAATDSRWGRLWTLRARLLSRHGDMEQAGRWARRAAETAARHQWAEVYLRAIFEVGSVAEGRLDLDRAEVAYQEVRLRAIHQEDAEMVGLGLLALARVEGRRHRYDRARMLATEARGAFRTQEDALHEAESLHLMGAMELAVGSPHRALELAQRALDLTLQDASRAALAASWSNLGEALRASGDLDGAMDAYARAGSLYEALGHWRASLQRVNQALVFLARDDTRQARPFLEQAQRVLESRGLRHLLGTVHLALVPCAAAVGDWISFETHLRAGRAHLAAAGFAHQDAAWCALRGGDLARDAGRHTSAMNAYRLSRDQYSDLGDAERADELSDRIAQLVSLN